MLYAIGSDFVVKEPHYNYEFENPSSEESAKLPLDHFSQTFVHWHFLTNYRPSEKSEEIMIARLIEFMRWTKDTVHEETGRSPQFYTNFPLTNRARSNKKTKRQAKTHGPDQSGCTLHFSNVFYDRKSPGTEISNDFQHLTVAHDGTASVSPAPVSVERPGSSGLANKTKDGMTLISTPYRSNRGSLIATAIRLPGQSKVQTNTLNIFVSPPVNA